jgi:hypothetical protein
MWEEEGCSSIRVESNQSFRCGENLHELQNLYSRKQLIQIDMLNKSLILHCFHIHITGYRKEASLICTYWMSWPPAYRNKVIKWDFLLNTRFLGFIWATQKQAGPLSIKHVANNNLHGHKTQWTYWKLAFKKKWHAESSKWAAVPTFMIIGIKELHCDMHIHEHNTRIHD